MEAVISPHKEVLQGQAEEDRAIDIRFYFSQSPCLFCNASIGHHGSFQSETAMSFQVSSSMSAEQVTA